MRSMFRNVSWSTLALSVIVAAASFAKADDRPNAYVLAVGVDRYQHALVPDLKGCVNDAKNAAATLRKQQNKIFANVEIHSLVDAAATEAAIGKEMQWLAGKGKPNDFIVLFLSGHGSRDGNAFSFLPHDFNPAQKQQTSLHGASILKMADALATQGKKVWIIVDACFAGQLRLDARDILNRHQEPGKGGVILMVSSMPRQTSADLGKFSAFAHALDQALNGEADFNRDGNITLQEIRRYTYSRVHDLVKGNVQDAEIDYSLSMSETLILGKVATPVFFQAGKLTPQDPIDKVRPGCFSKVYFIKVAGGKYVIDLESGDGRPGPHNPGYFDTFLRLEDASGKVLQSNDDGGEGRNSRIHFESPDLCTMYRLVVTSCYENTTGDFALRVRRQE